MDKLAKYVFWGMAGKDNGVPPAANLSIVLWAVDKLSEK